MKYYPQPIASLRYVILMALWALALGGLIFASAHAQEVAPTGPATAQVDPQSGMRYYWVGDTPYWEVRPDVWTTAPELIAVIAPPTPDQRQCIETYDKAHKGVHVADVATTGVILAMGGSEIGLSAVAGPFAIPVMLLSKFIVLQDSKTKTKLLIERGEYDRACKRLKARAAGYGAVSAWNVAQIVSGM